MELTPEEKLLEDVWDKVSKGEISFHEAETKMKNFQSTPYRDKLLELLNDLEDGQ